MKDNGDLSTTLSPSPSLSRGPMAAVPVLVTCRELAAGLNLNCSELSRSAEGPGLFLLWPVKPEFHSSERPVATLVEFLCTTKAAWEARSASSSFCQRPAEADYSFRGEVGGVGEGGITSPRFP